MLEYLIQLPCEVLGHNMLGYLELIDIIQLERATSSHKWQPLLRAILHYCPPVVLSEKFILKYKVLYWFNKRQCRVKVVKMDVNWLYDVDFEHSILHNIELCMYHSVSLNDILPLRNRMMYQNVTSLKIKGDQDPTAMEVLFSLLSNSSRVHCLDIESSNLSQWMNHIKKIGPCLREISLCKGTTDFSLIKTITEYCPYLEKLSWSYVTGVSDSNILQTIASNCPHLRSLEITGDFISDANLTAFAEECPQLEELSLSCKQLTDQSVIALTQHCCRLKKLKLYQCKLTVISLIALSKRGLPLEEFYIPSIPISSAEIAAQCAHALSRIHSLSFSNRIIFYFQAIQYMTGLRALNLWGSEDHLLVPHLLLLLQGQCCAGLESLYIYSGSSITSQQLSELVARCSNLHTLYIVNSACTSDAVLLELARSCPHLQKVTLYSIGEVTEEGVLALAVRCRQLREIHIPKITVTEETVRQLAQHCRCLTDLCVYLLIKKGERKIAVLKEYSSKQMRAIREQPMEGCK